MNESIKRESPIGIRPPKELRATIQKIAQDERRSAPSVVVYIVDQYLASTKGKLLKNVKVVPSEDHAA